MHPVVNMSWKDAVQFCKWLSKKENKTYELPTEAEWEYSCRAGTTTAYYFGDDPKDLDSYAWYQGNSEHHSHPVGGKKPNPWGLYDMSGNVWEWCADGFNVYEYGYIKDPKYEDAGGRLLRGGGRVLRGGSWYDDPSGCRSATRYNEGRGSIRYDFHGFRVVLRPAVQTP